MAEATLYLQDLNVVDVVGGTSSPGDIAIVGERIAAVGPGAQLNGLVDERTVVWNLKGKTAVPGLIDAHSHFTGVGMSLQEPPLSEARSIADVLAVVAAEAEKAPAGTLVHFWGLQENLLAENRFPTRTELDAVAPNHFVHVGRADGHSSVVNTKAFALLGYTPAVSGVERIGGVATGVLRADAHYGSSAKLAAVARPGARQQAIQKASQRALEVGLTSVQCLEGGRFSGEDSVLTIMEAGPDLPVHTLVWYQTTDIARVKDLGLPRIGGCILVDGAPGSYTGALFEPYSDKPDTNGLLYFTNEELNAFVLAAHRAGFPISMHATCQRAVEQLLRAYELALEIEPKTDHRFRIEHCYGMPTSDQLERMGRRGIICSTQPAFLHYRMDMYCRRFGERWRQVHPHKSALEHGVIMAGGSDSPVTPLYPLLGIHCAVNHPVPKQRVSVAEALRWFTLNAAYAAFEENEKGSLVPGKLADVTILGGDVLTCDQETIKDLRVEATIVGGQVRYECGKALE